MSKRAVVISYAMIRDLITDDNVIEQYRVKSGIPEHAVLVEMFPHHLSAYIIMVFESKEWDCEPLDLHVTTPQGKKVFEHPVSIEKRVHQNEYSKALHINNNKFRITSKTPILVMEEKGNKDCADLNSGWFSDIGEWVEIEELT